MYLGSATKNEGQKTASIVSKILNGSFLIENVEKKVFVKFDFYGSTTLNRYSFQDDAVLSTAYESGTSSDL